ncbi:hypoxanthine phosphoribosyltransferase [Clonorchis sinensis]|uniref:Hypoxanthine phosphoribosyltransferase n=1 Tax=Clonorchis sinensis TaxID=79923 RepID=G7YAZ4_CLOSI|nr:hypoxanthine phosphoribosyltransferase [Clonorchis sinensis]
MRRTLEDLQNFGVQIVANENFVRLEYADDIVVETTLPWLSNKPQMYGSEASVLDTDVMLSMMMAEGFENGYEGFGCCWTLRGTSYSSSSSLPTHRRYRRQHDINIQQLSRISCFATRYCFHIVHTAVCVIFRSVLAFGMADNEGNSVIGAVRFLGELHHAMEKIIRARELDLELEQSFVRLQSYLVMVLLPLFSQNDRSVQEPVITGLHDPSEFKDKDILIVEDLIDTGRSMRALLARLDDLSPRRVKISSLLVKRIPTGIQVRPDFVGFEIPNEFVVGYALDYNEHFRDLPHICVINQHGREKYYVRRQ